MPATAPRLTLEARSWAINAQWRTVKHRYGVRGKALIRVARMPPEECMEQLLAFLSSEEGCQSLYLDGKPLSDEWLPLSAWYERTTATNRTETVEVYHALRHVSDATADGPYVVHDGCAYKESHTFYFGVANLPELPADASGVQHRIESLRRDEESGLYSCVLTKRERLTIDIPEYVTHADATQVRNESALLGVQGNQAAVDAEAAERIGERVPGVGGVIVDVAKRKNEDCTTDLTVTITEEQAISEAEVVKSEDVFTKIERINEQNQPAAEALPEQAVGKIVRVTNRKTPGGSFDTTVDVTESKPALGARKAAETIYEKSSSELQRNQHEVSAAESSAGEGMRVEQRITFNPDKTADVETVTITEKPVLEAEVERTENAYHTVMRTTHRHQPAPASPSEFTPGTIQRVTNARTPGGTYNSVVETTEAKTNQRVGTDFVRDAYMWTEIETHREKTSAQFFGQDVQNGIVKRVDEKMLEDGTYEIRTVTTTELPQENAEVVYEANALETTARTVHRHVKTQNTSPAPVDGQIVRKSSKLNPGGTYDNEVATTIARAKSYTILLAADPNGTRRRITTFRNLTKAQADAFLQAAHSGSASPNAFGLYDGSCTTIIHQEGDRKLRTRRDIGTYEIENTTGDIRIVSANGKIYKVTESITYRCGVLHDTNVSSTSKESAYAKVDGCLNPDVKNLGDGYWQYYGITGKTITWESTTDSEVIEHSWSV